MTKVKKKCLICQRIALIKKNKNPYFIKELKTGYAVLGDHQLFPGYCLLLCKQHKTELHQLDKKFNLKFLEEMSLLAKAIFKAFKPKKLNYELLGNFDNHLHWHIFPRYGNDAKPNTAVWAIKHKILYSKKNIPSKKVREDLINKIRKNLHLVMKN